MATMLLRKIAATAELKPVKQREGVIGNNRERNAHGNLYRDPKIQTGGGPRGWLSNLTLNDIDNGFRKVTVNPLIRSLMIGGLLAGGTYLAGPAIGRIGRNVFGTRQEYDEYGNPVDISAKDRKWLAGIAGGLGLLGSAAFSADTRRPFLGLMSYAPKKMMYDNQTAKNEPEVSPMRRTASMLDRNDLIPLNMAKEGIMSNPNLTLEMKSRSLDVLNSFPNQNQAVSSNDIVNTAVNTGISGLTGYAVGYLTSTALGLGNPSQVGKTTGIMSALKTLF